MSRRRKQGLSFIQKEKKINKKTVEITLSWFFWIAVSVMLAWVTVYCVGMRVSMIGESMSPVFENGQEMMVNKFVYMVSKPRHDDIIVFRPNGNEKSHYYVKRVVGVPGDTILIVNGKLLVNGEVYDGDAAFDKIADPGLAANSIVLGKDEYFVMGDMCNSSEDSRSGNLGNVTGDVIVGKVWLRLPYEDSKLEIIK